MNKRGDAIITAENLSKSYQDGNNEIQVLIDLNCTLFPGDLVAILGPSGSGKSTLLHLLGGLDKPTKGVVKWEQEDINQLPEHKRCQLRGQKLGFVYQFHHLLPEFTALENVMMPALIVGMQVQEAEEKASYCLEQVGLGHRLKHKPAELSGGERQRTAIARALINDPVCVLADEPTGNLDEKSASNFYELLMAINEKHRTAFLLATHDQAAKKYLHKIYRMHEGHLVLE